MSQPAIPMFRVLMSGEAYHLVGGVLGSGYIGQGPRVVEFERALHEVYGTHVPPLTVNSCTSALDLAMHLCDVGPGRTVVTTPQTCTATNSPIVTRGAGIIWADVDPITGLIDPDDVARKIRPNTAAIVAVDWAGRPCDYPALRSHGVPVIQDAAHRAPRALGAHGDYVCLSFQAIKHLTTGDGGALVVPGVQYERARLLRWYGLDRESKADFRCEQDITEVGYKYHMNDISAAIGIGNLDAAQRMAKRARDNARLLDDYLADLPGLDRPPYDDACDFWLYTILVDNRASLEVRLRRAGIASSQVHARNDRHTAFAACAVGGFNLPGLESFAARQLSIPVGWWVTEADVLRIANVIRAHLLGGASHDEDSALRSRGNPRARGKVQDHVSGQDDRSRAEQGGGR